MAKRVIPPGEVKISLKDYHSLTDNHLIALKTVEEMKKSAIALGILINDIADLYNITKMIHEFNAMDNGLRIVPSSTGKSNQLVIELTGEFDAI